MKNILATLLVTLAALSAQAQQSNLTTFILVRHAEKETGAASMKDGVMTKDPELSEAGKARALRLADMLQRQPVAAIYSTNYKRTQHTVQPLADKTGLIVQLYEPLNDQVIRELAAKHKGKTIVIVGHSNNIPQIANVLVGKKEFSDYDEHYYENMMLVTVVEPGIASVVQIKY
jgi:2,3-bisphosphoglycerate-dependent phosphoglycerate mutase